MQMFTTGLKAQTCLLLDALSGDTMKTKTAAEVRDLINNMPLIDHNAETWAFKKEKVY